MFNNPIGVMDSGVGGLTVVRALHKLLPNEDIVYVGDEKHCPYGPKKPEEITNFVEEIAQFLIKNYHIKLFVIACNTASAFALPEIQNHLDIPVIGMIDSGSLAAVRATQTKQIALLATEGTVHSQSYMKHIQNIDDSIEVTGIACPEFVHMVELGTIQEESSQEAIFNRIGWIHDSEIDTVILGCTHFPLMKEEIQNCVGKEKTLVDAGEASSQKVVDVLTENHLQSSSIENGKITLLTTGNPNSLERVAREWIDESLVVEQVEVK